MKRFAALASVITVFLFSAFPVYGGKFDDLSGWADYSEIPYETLEKTDIIYDFEQSEKNTGKISGFDISENGDIAVVYSNYVTVYDNDFSPLYSFGVMAEGNIFLGWKEELLLIYLEKSDKGYCVNDGGQIVTGYEFDPDSISNEEYETAAKCTEIEYNGEIYRLENQLISGYTRLIRMDADGNETALFDETSAAKRNIAVGATVIVLIIAMIVWGVVTAYRKKKNENE